MTTPPPPHLSAWKDRDGDVWTWHIDGQYHTHTPDGHHRAASLAYLARDQALTPHPPYGPNTVTVTTRSRTGNRWTVRVRSGDYTTCRATVTHDDVPDVIHTTVTALDLLTITPDPPPPDTTPAFGHYTDGEGDLWTATGPGGQVTYESDGTSVDLFHLATEYGPLTPVSRPDLTIHVDSRGLTVEHGPERSATARLARPPHHGIETRLGHLVAVLNATHRPGDPPMEDPGMVRIHVTIPATDERTITAAIPRDKWDATDDEGRARILHGVIGGVAAAELRVTTRVLTDPDR